MSRGLWTADVTAPLANSPPKSRLALAVEPPEVPPRYPSPGRSTPRALVLTAASRPFGSACITAPERVVTLDDLICLGISLNMRAGGQETPALKLAMPSYKRKRWGQLANGHLTGWDPWLES